MVDTLEDYNPDNVFAKILRGELPSKKVYEDDFVMAFHDINPQAPTHVLVIPKAQYVSLQDFATQASERVIVGLIRAVPAIVEELGLVDSGYRVLINAGPDSHQEVPHLHLHIFGGKKLGPMLDRNWDG